MINNYKQKIKSKKFHVDPKKQKDFKVVHFAGDVHYEVNNFIDKNQDVLYDEFVIQLAKSTNKIVYGIFK